MPEQKIQWAWVSRELAAAGCTMNTPANAAVVNLLGVFSDEDLTDAEREFVIDAFARLALGQALARPSEAMEEWKDCVPGDYQVRDTVRVRSAAYQGEHGMWHNGRRGRIVGTRNNSVIVVYDGDNAEQAVHHSPNSLEVLVQ